MATPESFETRQQNLINRYEDAINEYRRESKKQGRRVLLVRLLVLFFSVAVTVLSGIAAAKDRFSWPITVTVVAGLSTFVAGLLPVTKTAEAYAIFLWTVLQLKRELLLYEYGAGIYAGLEREEQLRKLVEQLAKIDEINSAEATKRIISSGKSE